MRTVRGNDAALPWRARRRCGVRMRRCLPCGQKRCRAARRIWVCHGKSGSPTRFAHQGALSARRGTRSPSPVSPAAAFSPCRPAGRTAGSARTRPRDPSLGNPFLGDGGHPSISPIPQNAAGGKPLLVGLPPSSPVSAPCGTKRSTHAPYSWGMGASTQRRRHWPAALPP